MTMTAKEHLKAARELAGDGFLALIGELLSEDPTLAAMIAEGMAAAQAAFDTSTPDPDNLLAK